MSKKIFKKHIMEKDLKKNIYIYTYVYILTYIKEHICLKKEYIDKRT